MGSSDVTQDVQPGALWQPRGMERQPLERMVQEGEDVYTHIPMANVCCKAESNATLWSYSPIKKKKLFVAFLTMPFWQEGGDISLSFWFAFL